jgi:hypothetical protein
MLLLRVGNTYKAEMNDFLHSGLVVTLSDDDGNGILDQNASLRRTSLLVDLAILKAKVEKRRQIAWALGDRGVCARCWLGLLLVRLLPRLAVKYRRRLLGP